MRNIRLRAFSLRIGAEVGQVVSMLNSASFSIEDGSGVELLDEEAGFYIFRYHEQTEIIDNITDVYGSPQRNSYLQYISFKFYLIELSPGLLQVFIESPPKSLKQFVSTLRRAFLGAFSFDAVKLDVYEWYMRFKDFSGLTRVRILKAQSSIIIIDDDSSFRIAVESSSNAIVQMERVVMDRKLSLDKLKLSFFYQHTERVVELSGAFNIILSGWSAVESLTFIMSVRSCESI